MTIAMTKFYVPRFVPLINMLIAIQTRRSWSHCLGPLKDRVESLAAIRGAQRPTVGDHTRRSCNVKLLILFEIRQ